MNKTLILLVLMLAACAPTYANGTTPTVTPKPASRIAEEYAGAVWYPPTPGPASPAMSCATVTAIKALNLRAGPGTDQAVIKTLEFGERVDILDSSTNWWKVRAGNKIGFANARYLQVCP